MPNQLFHCGQCGEAKEISKYPNNKFGDESRKICRACLTKRERAQLKLEMIANLGGKCVCCGETNPFFLSLDHVNNDGNLHKLESSKDGIYRDARREGWPRDKYQCLCSNCNFAKGHFGTCPHTERMSTEEAYAKLLHVALTNEEKLYLVRTEVKSA